MIGFDFVVSDVAYVPSKGRTKVKVEPFPTTERTPIFPPIFSTRILLNGSPSPYPFFFSASFDTYVRKMESMSFGSMPEPVSLT